MIPGVARRPSIFIGSSTEQLPVANAVQENLDFEYEPTVWSQDIFRPSNFALIDLIRATRSYDFATFVFVPDDVTHRRGKEVLTVRDNVIFELGMFMGALQPERCFIIVPRGHENLRLPTDLLGFSPLTYRPDRSDENLLAAVGPACNQIRRAVNRLFPIDQDSRVVGRVENEVATKPRVSADTFIGEWNGPELKAAREAMRELPLDHYSEEAQQIRPYLKRIFRFLEDMSAVVLEGRSDENKLRPTFEKPVLILWPHFFTLLAPPNQASEWWETRLPKLAKLYARWSSGRHP
jgi:hypothetical protein